MRERAENSRQEKNSSSWQNVVSDFAMDSHYPAEEKNDTVSVSVSGYRHFGHNPPLVKKQR